MENLELKLYSETDASKTASTFRLRKKLSGKGSFAVSYDAEQSAGRGVLKEFYPRDLEKYIRRSENGENFFISESENLRTEFISRREDYLKPYRLLQNFLRENPELYFFIPHFEIYFNSPAEKNSVETAFIWTPGTPESKTFEKFCAELHKNPAKKSEHKLFTALNLVYNLTLCTCAMHRAGLVHGDIKPSNFGFLTLNEKLSEPLKISLFDVNSISSVYQPPKEKFYSPGYTEPEFSFENPCNLTDIYSIGATLFHAIILTEETAARNFTYADENFAELKNLVAASELIKCSTTNSDPKLRAILTKIFQKTLCPRENRFKDCEELAENLNRAICRLLPNELSARFASGEKLILRDAEKSLRKAERKNAETNLKYHLYKYPLYEKVRPNESTLKVLIFGCGNYGQKFLDYCLQLAQVVGKNFSATIITEDIADKELYLSERPEMKNFFSIDGSTPTFKPALGEIFFEEKKISLSQHRANSDAVDDVISNLCDEDRPHYIFVAFGNDTLNKNIAERCREAAHALENDCRITFVSEEKYNRPSYNGIIPVNVCEPVEKNPIHPEIERQALNVHLVWEKNLNVDIKKVKAEFRKPYYYAACVANVLAVKYKLFRLGIAADKIGVEVAAKIFAEKILSSGDKKNSEAATLKDKLMAEEHNRWVVEKICSGMIRRSVAECIDGKFKDDKKNSHACLVPCRSDSMLQKKYPDQITWDALSPAEISELDDLDQLSVNLHKIFLERAEEIKKSDSSRFALAEDIKSLILRDKKAIDAFAELFSCLNDVWNGNRDRVKLLANLKANFLNAIENLPKEKSATIAERLAALEKIYKYAVLSMEYRDFKDDDRALNQNIPFILTYSENIQIVVPFAAGNCNDELFKFIAAAVVINPAKIIYAAICENKSGLDVLKNSLSHILSYIRRKNLKSEVEFVAVCNFSQSACETAAEDLKSLDRNRIKVVNFIRLPGFKNSPEKVTREFEKYFRRKTKTKARIILEFNSSPLSILFSRAATHMKFDSYSFDSRTMKFESISNCEFPKYIRKKNFITVNDLNVLNNSQGNSGRRPPFFWNFEKIWQQYFRDTATWKILCNNLSRHSEQNDVIAKLKTSPNTQKGALVEKEYIIPVECMKSAEKILQHLKEKNIIKRGEVKAVNSESCEVSLSESSVNAASYDKIFSCPEKLLNPEYIFFTPKDGIVGINFDSLSVKNFLPEGNFPFQRLQYLLKFLEAEKLLNNVKIDAGSISFTYATRAVKELLTVAGQILELKIYYDCANSGNFDDVAVNFVVGWEKSSQINEFDCVLTKGFATLFVECKARGVIEQDFYFKFNELRKKFGINSIGVLIADTGKSTELSPSNLEQIKRGEELGVITIWKNTEIENIGKKLSEILLNSTPKKISR